MKTIVKNLIPLFLFCICLQSLAGTPVIVSSPDGGIRLTVKSESGKLFYSVDFNNKTIIESSRLGLLLSNQVLGDQVTIGIVDNYAVENKYSYRGIHALAVDKFNGARITIESTGIPFVLEARIFNDGVAFRYVFDTGRNSIIEKDSTVFKLPVGSVVWSQPNIRHYEARYSKKKIEEFAIGDILGPPATIAFPNNLGYAAITEGGLTDFAGMSLLAKGNRELVGNFTGLTTKKGKVESSWRIIEIGKDLNTLVNCDIIANVSPPFDPLIFPKGYETEWIKPGRSVWSWLAGRGPVTFENMKIFSDMASSLGFEYNLVDDGWGKWRSGDKDEWTVMKELVDYSATKGVKIWAWVPYPDRNGLKGIKDPGVRKDFFQKCKQIGIVGVKIDFFDSEAQEIIQFYQTALKEAAEHQLMVNFHGANKPTGEARTWPNEMSREAVKGLESRPPWAPTNTVLPFTRYLAGHGDFTPINFGERLGEVTWAHHVATMVIFTSPFLCLGANPQNIIDNPCKEMVKSIPSTWDETIVLPQSKIGELVVFARRKGDVWYIAALNGLQEKKSIEIDLSFLNKGSWKIAGLKDDQDKQANVVVENVKIARGKPITLILNPAGGYVGRITKK